MTYNKAFKSDSQRLAVSLRSSIAKRRSHLNAALALGWDQRLKVLMFIGFSFPDLHLIKCASHVRSGGTRCIVFAWISPFTVSNFRAISLARFLFCGWFLASTRFFGVVVQVR